jgi:putative membrane protein
VLGVLLAGFVAFSWHGARYPADWYLENLLVLVAVLYLAATARALPLSRFSYVLILVFLGFHEIGAHWTFAEVPYDEAARRWLGFSVNEALGWTRNHYDRLVHFLYGFLLLRPMRETLGSVFDTAGARGAVLAWVFLFATSSLYEQLEWAAALVFGGDLGQAYLGTQGDVWDAHKDTLLAALGAALALAVPGLSGRGRRGGVEEAR